MESDIFFKIIEILLQLFLVVLAWRALSVWKKEIRGKDRYFLAKNLLEYIKDLRFLIYSKDGSLHQIYLNDMLSDQPSFYKDQLATIRDEKAYFDESVWKLFSHLKIRSDFFINKELREILLDLYPVSGKNINTDKNQFTYIHLDGFNKNPNQDLTEGIYEMHTKTPLTIEKYFKKWNDLIVKLQKLI